MHFTKGTKYTKEYTWNNYTIVHIHTEPCVYELILRFWSADLISPMICILPVCSLLLLTLILMGLGGERCCFNFLFSFFFFEFRSQFTFLTRLKIMINILYNLKIYNNVFQFFFSFFLFDENLDPFYHISLLYTTLILSAVIRRKFKLAV